MIKMVVLAFLTLATAAVAQTLDCSTINLGQLGRLSYTVLEVPPNLSKRESYSLERTIIDFEDCGVKIIADGEGYASVFIADKRQFYKLISIPNATIKNRVSFPMVGVNVYEYPSTKEVLYSRNAWLVLFADTGNLGTFSLPETASDLEFLKEATISYKVDGGPLTPFFHEGKVIRATLPTNIKTLDIYASRSDYDKGFDRVRIDFENSSYELWKKYPFPAN
jgi:hypothetical protein